MATNMSPSEILYLIETDLEFAINFIIDNNPSAVESNISGLSIPLPQDPSNLQLKEVIDDLLNDSDNQNAPQQIDDILSVPYLESVDNYTGNLEGELEDLGVRNGTIIPGKANESQGSVVVSAIAGILSAVGQVWGGILNNKNLELQQDIINDQQAHELEMLEKTRVFGIPQTIILALLGFFAIVMIILLMANKKK